MSLIVVLNADNSSSRLRSCFNLVNGPYGDVDNILTVHSLCPRILAGKMANYRGAMYHSAKTLPMRLLSHTGGFAGIASFGLAKTRPGADAKPKRVHDAMFGE